MPKGKLINLLVNKRKQAIKVIQSNGYWAWKHYVEIPVEEFVVCDNFIPDKDLMININDGEAGDQFLYAEVKPLVLMEWNMKTSSYSGNSMDLIYVDNQSCFSKL